MLKNMAKDAKATGQSSATKTGTTKLSGVDSSQVRPSKPQLIKEIFQIELNKGKTSKPGVYN